jgi:protein SCO1/2
MIAPLLAAAVLLAATPQAGAGAAAGGAAPCACHPAKPSGAGSATRTTATYEVPAVKLVDQRGKEVDLRALLSTSQPVALNFIFTSCRTICPVLSASLAGLRREVKGDVTFVSVTIDPEYDTPRVLDAYAKRFDVGPRWTLLTGSPDAVAAVRRAFDAASTVKDAHRPLTYLRPGGSGAWIRFDGFPSAAELAASLLPQPVRASR